MKSWEEEEDDSWRLNVQPATEEVACERLSLTSGEALPKGLYVKAERRRSCWKEAEEDSHRLICLRAMASSCRGREATRRHGEEELHRAEMEAWRRWRTG